MIVVSGDDVIEDGNAFSGSSTAFLFNMRTGIWYSMCESDGLST